jgi:hypothetical protein
MYDVIQWLAGKKTPASVLLSCVYTAGGKGAMYSITDTSGSEVKVCCL